MQDTSDCERVREHSRYLSHASVIVNRLKFSCVEESVPIRHVNDKVIVLQSGVRELREKPTGV
mgnify:CR=1 FL=1